MKIELPTPCLVALIGASGAGKTTFALKHFKETEIVSSDEARAMVCDDEGSLEHNDDAFELVHFIAKKRLENMRTVVIDATNVQNHARKPLVRLAKEHHLFPVAIVLDVPAKTCLERNESRPDRQFGDHVVHGHRKQLKRSIRHLKKEGFRFVHVLGPEQIEALEIERTSLYSHQHHERGPFDVIGDVHGCATELEELLAELGYEIEWTGARNEGPHWGVRVRAPHGRRIIFVGDFCDRGPRTPDVFRIAMSAAHDDVALAVPGNHDVKLERALGGRKVKIAHGLGLTLEQLEDEPDALSDAIREYVRGLVSHIVVDGGDLVVAHAGCREDYQGRSSGKVRSFCLYGDTTGERDEYGLPVRLDWARDYRGDSMVVYGHTPVPFAEWLNNTINIDTGCVFGGRLTAVRLPERELISVDAHETYAESIKPIEFDEGLRNVIDIRDVTGRRTVTTRLIERMVVREENAAAALEIMSRFAVDPRWLIYLPPTMSPSATSERDGYLEHPAEALEAYRSWDQDSVVAQVKHMGSRALALVCRDVESAAARFVDDGRQGRIFTRTGRPFFNDDSVEAEVLARVEASCAEAGLWDALDTDWVLLDCELMPWSAKAVSLLQEQYATAGSAARAATAAATRALREAASRGVEVEGWVETMRMRNQNAHQFTAAYRHYCWPFESVDDLRLAPFHVMASAGRSHVDQDHLWHMDWAERLASTDDELVFATEWRKVDVNDEDACEALYDWWTKLTEAGGEGLVIKPLDFVARNAKGRLVQPAVKTRGREYLRIIYGPTYTEPDNLKRLRRRGLKRKRSLALREFALGIEALERFANDEPLRRTHECVFAVLAMESEPVDPRL